MQKEGKLDEKQLSTLLRLQQATLLRQISRAVTGCHSYEPGYRKIEKMKSTGAASSERMLAQPHSYPSRDLLTSDDGAGAGGHLAKATKDSRAELGWPGPLSLLGPSLLL